MFRLLTKRSMWLTVALSCCFLATNTAQASDDDDDNKQRTRTVNCYEHHASVQKEIDKVKIGRDTTIFIVGYCDERVSIVKDGITLSGNKDGSGVIGGGLTEVTVTGAQRVQIEYLNITGSGYGVLVEEGASVMIQHNEIHNNIAAGVAAFNQVFVRLEFNDITGNGRVEEFEAGIDGSGGVTIRSKGNYIADNAYAAVEIGNMSFFRSGVSGGSPDDRDTFLQKGCSGGEPAGTCGHSGSFAVDCFKNGLCDFRNTDVTGRIEISGLSNFEVRNSTINGNIDGSGGSRLRLRNTVSSGLVSCGEATIALYNNPCGVLFP
jgi:hypothetical protein